MKRRLRIPPPPSARQQQRALRSHVREYVSVRVGSVDEEIVRRERELLARVLDALQGVDVDALARHFSVEAELPLAATLTVIGKAVVIIGAGVFVFGGGDAETLAELVRSGATEYRRRGLPQADRIEDASAEPDDSDEDEDELELDDPENDEEEGDTS